MRICAWTHARRLALAALLYGSPFVIASAPLLITSTVTFAQSTVPGVAAVDAPHIALLLPVDSSTFRRHAEALRDGFIAASKADGKASLAIRVYAVGDDPKQASAVYAQAVQTGARMVVGPLLRTAATAIAAADAPVPTLLLNAPDGNAPVRANVYVLSLHIEAEARQLAQLAHREGRRAAYVVAGDSPLLKRLHQAFATEFAKLGGKVVAEYAYNTSPAELARLKEAAQLRLADMVFLALDTRQARSVRAYLEPLHVYASSQVYTGDASPAANLELNGVTFLDMPWLLQRDHTAVMVYPRQDFRGEPDLDRLYALGVDAFRIGRALLAREANLTLDGVTGKLAAGRDRQFTRELTRMRIGSALPPTDVGPSPGAAPATAAKPAPAVTPKP